MLNQKLICLKFLFGFRCALAIKILRIYHNLDKLSHKHTHSDEFEQGMCKTICNDITKGCVDFSEQHTTNYDIQNDKFATVDLSST